MPNVKSAWKRMRTNKKRNLRNRARRSALRTALRNVDEQIATGDTSALDKVVRAASSVIGTTGGKGVIHRKKASRLQSRLRLRANRAMAAAAGQTDQA